MRPISRRIRKHPRRSIPGGVNRRQPRTPPLGKHGIAFVVAFQEAKDFDPSLFMAVANYLALRLNETDARLIAKTFSASDRVAYYADRIKQMPKYQAMFYGEGLRAPVRTILLANVVGSRPHR